MNAVKIKKEAKTITAQGGCKAEDPEVPLEKEGVSVVMDHLIDTGKLRMSDPLELPLLTNYSAGKEKVVIVFGKNSDRLR